MLCWCWEALGTCEMQRGPPVKRFNCRAEEQTREPTSLHMHCSTPCETLTIKCYGFSCPKKTESKYILYTSFWILHKLQYLYKDCLAVGAAMAGNGQHRLKAKGSPTAETTAGEQLLTRCTCLAQSWHWVEGAEPQWHNSSMLLKSVHLTPTYACRHLRSWIILAANQEVMGCTFLWKHSLSISYLSVSVDSLSLCVPFVLLVFICPSKDFHVTIYETKRRKIYRLNSKAQDQVPTPCFFPAPLP